MSLAPYAAYRKLWAYVVLQALRDANSYQDWRYKPAQEWLEDDAFEVGSLAWICELFDVDFQRVRRAVATRESRRAMLDCGWELNCEENADDE